MRKTLRPLLALAVSLSARAETPSLPAIRDLIEGNRFPEAADQLKAIIASSPQSADAHYLLGYMLFRQVKARESLAEYTQAAALRRPTAFDLKIVGCDYVLLADYMDADKWFTQAVSWAPQDVEGWYYLGRAKYNENRFEEAVQAFTHLLSLDPKHIRAEDNLGLSYEGLGKLEEAERCYRQAIEWQAAGNVFADPYINLGALLITESKSTDALPLLTKAVSLAPDDYRSYLQLGKAYLALNDTAKAKAALLKAIDLQPKNASLHYVLGQIYRKDGSTQEAKAEFDRYTQLSGSPR